MDDPVKRLRIELMVLKNAVLALLAKLEEKEILTFDEQIKILSASGAKLRKKTE